MQIGIDGVVKALIFLGKLPWAKAQRMYEMVKLATGFVRFEFSRTFWHLWNFNLNFLALFWHLVNFKLNFPHFFNIWWISNWIFTHFFDIWWISISHTFFYIWWISIWIFPESCREYHHFIHSLCFLKKIELIFMNFSGLCEPSPPGRRGPFDLCYSITADSPLKSLYRLNATLSKCPIQVIKQVFHCIFKA